MKTVVAFLAFALSALAQLSPRELSQLTREGYSLTPEQASGLETRLADAPDDLDARARLLGFYFAPASGSLEGDARIQARRRHVLWLIANQPESPLLASAEATINKAGQYLGDQEGYDLVRKAWLDAASKKDATATVLGNAARFFYLQEKVVAADLLGKARKLEPTNSVWVAAQGSVMAFALVGITAVNQNGIPGPANFQEAASPAAKSIRKDLEATKDGDLLVAVANELMQRGIMAQTLAHSSVTPVVDAMDFAETLLKRAQELDPEKSSIHSALARMYELRLMQDPVEEKKKTFTRARYEQLVRANAGQKDDDPANAQNTLALARAAMDAGDVDRAQTLAMTLLAMTPKLDANPKLKWMVDGITHHSYLILGRGALRRGDVETARTDLLDAAKVGGGGTLASFGPNMTLAKELLEKGEKGVVLTYLDLCRKFWIFADRLDTWIAEIKKDKIPDFGPNLTY